MRRALTITLLLGLHLAVIAQPARDSIAGCWGDTLLCLRTINDSLHQLRLTTPAGTDSWSLPYPVYRIDTGDINGDGSRDIMVGVIKSTRFNPEKGRRLFIFKNLRGKIRPLWMGSRLGGLLHDFRFIDGKIRAIETTTDGWWVVAEYRRQGFGMYCDRFIKTKVSQEEAYEAFYR